MDLATYLEGLPAPQLDALYASPWTCRALLRALAPVGRLYVARLLLPPPPVPAGECKVAVIMPCATMWALARARVCLHACACQRWCCKV